MNGAATPLTDSKKERPSRCSGLAADLSTSCSGLAACRSVRPVPGLSATLGSRFCQLFSRSPAPSCSQPPFKKMSQNKMPQEPSTEKPTEDALATVPLEFAMTVVHSRINTVTGIGAVLAQYTHEGRYAKHVLDLDLRKELLDLSEMVSVGCKVLDTDEQELEMLHESAEWPESRVRLIDDMTAALTNAWNRLQNRLAEEIDKNQAD